MSKRQIIVAVTGASGAIYAKLLLDRLKSLQSQFDDLGVIFSKNASEIWKYELKDYSFSDYPFTQHEVNDFYSPFASGSARYDTMIICPCSMGILGRIANGTSDDLITRAADVILKEKRKLILVPRETPYSLIHIRNMETVTLSGGIICPASPSFYGQAQTIEELATTVIDRILDLAGFEIDTKRWSE